MEWNFKNIPVNIVLYEFNYFPSVRKLAIGLNQNKLYKLLYCSCNILFIIYCPNINKLHFM